MKKMKRLVAVLLAGIMALAVLTACSGGSGTNSSEFENKVEQAYMAELNKTFATNFNNDAAIKKLAVDYLKEVGGAQTLSAETLWKNEAPTADTLNQVMVCFDTTQSTNEKYVKLYYEADKAEKITPRSDSGVNPVWTPYSTSFLIFSNSIILSPSIHSGTI